MYTHKAKKSLGQNFLTSKAVVSAAISAAKLDVNSVVLEIGPGKGFLTEDMLATGATVYAIEKDDDLFVFLQEKFSQYIESGTFILIHGDAVNDLESTIQNISKQHTSYSVIANIPYNITGLLIRRLLESNPQPTYMILMIQHEVAVRILARDMKESILSLSVSCYGDAKLIRKVSAGSFSPAPKVDSALILIEHISRSKFLNHVHEENYFKILHAGFAHKRKLLIRNLKNDLGDVNWDAIWQALSLSALVRAEDIHTNTYIELSRRITLG